MNRLLIPLIVLMTLVAGCEKHNGEPAAAIQRPAVNGVAVLTLTPTSVTEYYENTGTITASSTTAVAAKLMGTVTRILVREGDTIRKGDLLLLVDDRDISRRVAAAEAAVRETAKAIGAAAENLALAELTADRYQNLFDKEALSRQERDQVQTSRKIAALEYERLGESADRAAAGLEEARIMLGYTRITAPYDGLIRKKLIETGEMVLPGNPLFIMEDPSALEIEMHVNEQLTNRLQTGQTVLVEIPSQGSQFHAAITDIIATVDPGSRTFLVKIGLPGQELMSGLFARVRIPVGARELILVPADALVAKGQLTGVYTVTPEKNIRYRLVRPGRSYPEGIEIAAGLKAGERVIVDGLDRVVDGGVLANEE